MRVVVAMSGGVDSSTVAALLAEQGHEVIGLAMKTHNLEPRANRACCTPDDMRDARRVADLLDIPFYVLNYADLFRETIIEPFARAYQAGRTPNPCVVCNDKVKFEPLLKRAQLLGADRLATGHYARISETQQGPQLRRAVDRRKDQSYFLYRLRSEQLQRLWFPLGSMTKDEVREHAERLGLSVAHKHESQEICFVGSEGYARTVETILGDELNKEGDIVHEDGRVLGRHRGIHHYTLGQRRGLGLSHPEPLYVTDIDPSSNTVRVGPRAALKTEEIWIEDAHWLGGVPARDAELAVQQRYRERPKPVYVAEAGEGWARLRFASPENQGAPGQAAVIYDGDAVVGGGTVARPPRRSSLRVLGQDAAGQQSAGA